MKKIPLRGYKTGFADLSGSPTSKTFSELPSPGESPSWRSGEVWIRRKWQIHPELTTAQERSEGAACTKVLREEGAEPTGEGEGRNVLSWPVESPVVELPTWLFASIDSPICVFHKEKAKPELVGRCSSARESGVPGAIPPPNSFFNYW
jgi:hypothetical protein